MIHHGRQRRLEKLEIAIWHHESWVLFCLRCTDIASCDGLSHIPHSAFLLGEEMALDGYRRLFLSLLFFVFLFIGVFPGL